MVRRVREVCCIVLAGNPETDHLANLGVDGGIYSDTSANEFVPESHSLTEIFVSRNVISRRFL